MHKFFVSLLAIALVSAMASGLSLSAQAGVAPSVTVVRNERLLPPKSTSSTPKDMGDTTASENKSGDTAASANKSGDTAASAKNSTNAAHTPTPGTLQAKHAKKIAAARTKVSNTSFLSRIEKDTLAEHNKLRESLGLQTLSYDQDLQTAARIRSYELYKATMFAHTRPDGREWHTVLREDVPYTFVKAGENLCTTEYDPDDPSQYAYDADFWTDAWISSPSHYETMIDPAYNRIGIGIYYIEKNGIVYSYATALFARVDR